MFTIVLVALMAVSALVFDAAQALVLRRQLQDASDAAALTAANVLQSGTTRGCSATKGPPPGAARAQVVAAAQAAVLAMLPSTALSSIHVSCPAGWSNSAVEVDIDKASASYFGPAVGLDGFAVRAVSQAVNGQIASVHYSIVDLDPGNATWPSGRRGCPSVLISGGPTIILDGSMQINSACGAQAGGALGTNGNSATVTLNNGAALRMVGGYSPGPLTLTPTPVTGVAAIRDPLRNLPAMPVGSLPVRATKKQTFGGGSVVLEPGIYQGGIQLKSSATAFLKPGIYVMQDGGLTMGAQNAVYSIGNTVASTGDAYWASDCASDSCGVLIYNTGTDSTMGQVSVGAGATMRLRPYLPTADGTGASIPEFQGLLLWQDANPVPTSSFAQPAIALGGGGMVDISGTLYAPSAVVTLGGGSGASGGSSTDVTLQFISWDLQFQGNSSFHFYYSDVFARPIDYGLIKPGFTEPCRLTA